MLRYAIVAKNFVIFAWRIASGDQQNIYKLIRNFIAETLQPADAAQSRSDA